MAQDYYSGRGKLFIGTRDSAGPNGPLQFVGDVSDFSIGGSEDFLDFNESISGKDARVIHLPTNTDTSYSMTMRYFTAQNLAKATHGTVIGAAAAGTVTGEIHQAYNDSTFPLAHAGVSTVTVSAGGTALVLGTDYTVNANAGSVTILPGSTAVASSTTPTQVTVGYAYNAGSGGSVQALKGGIQEYVLYAELISRTNGRSYTFYAPRVTIDLSGEIVLLGGDVGQIDVGGAMLPAPEIAEGGAVSQYYTITIGA